jgi:hypothetical protein
MTATIRRLISQVAAMQQQESADPLNNPHTRLFAAGKPRRIDFAGAGAMKWRRESDRSGRNRRYH